MAEQGRIIKEHEIAYSWDYASIIRSINGNGLIIDHGDKCEPVQLDEFSPVIGVKSGVACGIDEQTFILDATEIIIPENTYDNPRYGVIYGFSDGVGNKIIDFELGAAAEDPKTPELPDHDVIPVFVPIAILYQEANTDDTVIFDCRTIVNATHIHFAGDGLELTDTAWMNAIGDEETVTVGADIGLKDDGVGWSKLKIEAGDGLRVELSMVEGDPDILHTDVGNGLGIDASDRLKVVTSDIDGRGLRVDGSDKLETDVGNGLQHTAARTRLSEGKGIILRGTTPDRRIDVYFAPGGGLDFRGDGRLFLKPSDFDGHGIQESNYKLHVYPYDFDGDGLKAEYGQLEVDAGNGITTENERIDYDLGRGLFITDGKPTARLYPGSGFYFELGKIAFKIPSTAAEGGLGYDEDLYVIEYPSGPIAVNEDVRISCGGGLALKNPGGEPEGEYILETALVDEGGLEFDDGEMFVKVTPIIGNITLVDDNNKFNINPGAGVEVQDGKFQIKSGWNVQNVSLQRHRTNLQGYGVRHFWSEQPELYLDTNKFFDMWIEDSYTGLSVGDTAHFTIDKPIPVWVGLKMDNSKDEEDDELMKSRFLFGEHYFEGEPPDPVKFDVLVRNEGSPWDPPEEARDLDFEIHAIGCDWAEDPPDEGDW